MDGAINTGLHPARPTAQEMKPKLRGWLTKHGCCPGNATTTNLNRQIGTKCVGAPEQEHKAGPAAVQTLWRSGNKRHHVPQRDDVY